MAATVKGLAESSPRMRSVVDHVLRSISARECLPTTVTVRRKVALVAASLAGVVEDDNVLAHHVCPTEWKLNSEERACVESVGYDALSKELRVRLIDRDSTSSAATTAAERLWEEVMPCAARVNPSSINVPISGLETLDDDAAAKELAIRIAREVVAAATVRSPSVMATVVRLDTRDETEPDDPMFFVSVKGLALLGPKVFDPRYWTETIPEDVAAALQSKYRISLQEYRVGVFKAAVDLFGSGGPAATEPTASHGAASDAAAAAASFASTVDSEWLTNLHEAASAELSRPTPRRPSHPLPPPVRVTTTTTSATIVPTLQTHKRAAPTPVSGSSANHMGPPAKRRP